MVITHPDQLCAAWIEDRLRHAGALQAGAVSAIEVAPQPLHAWSQSIRIRVRYRHGSTGECPPQLLLKTCGGEDEAFALTTLQYYERDYAGLAGAPLPRCYDAVHEAWPRRYHLLTRDAGDTHRPCDEDVPGNAHAEALADALASLHAHLWGAARLQAAGLPLPTAADVERYAAHVGAGLEPMIDAAPPEIDAHCARRLRHVFSRFADGLAARAQDGREMTQLHGDLNPANLLRPLAAAGPLLLSRRQPGGWQLTRWLGASDLVNAMVPWWDVPLRREFERTTLRRYHAALQERGIDGYPMERLIDDYRRCIVEAIALAAQWCLRADDRERLRWLWRRQLRRALTAYEDWHCAELWE